MDSIVLVELGDSSDALEQKRDECRTGGLGHGRKDGPESIGVCLPEIRWCLHAGDHHA